MKEALHWSSPTPSLPQAPVSPVGRRHGGCPEASSSKPGTAGSAPQPFPWCPDHLPRSADFVTYVNERAGEEARGFCRQGQHVLPGDLQPGRYRTGRARRRYRHLALQLTAAYARLQDIAGQRLSQKDLAEWMEDWRDF